MMLINLFLGLLLLGLIGFYLAVLFELFMEWRFAPKLQSVDRDPAELLADAVSLDIVIPARNEGDKIGRCLESLRQQTFTQFNVWMVNDRSTDQTEALMQQVAAQDERFHLIQGVEPPPGWVGKVNAIAQSWPHLGAPWLLFLDADTWLHPENLERALIKARQADIEMLTLLPHLECGSFWERVILPSVVFLIGMRFPTRKVNDPNRPDVAIANGQYILIQRAVYERMGRHEAVKHSIVEDLDLARYAKRLGVRLCLVNGARYFSVRMYTSLATLREGWTKNMYFGLPDYGEWVGLGQVVGTWAMGLLPFVTLPMAYWGTHSTGLVALSWGALGVMYLAMFLSRAYYGMWPAYVIFHPVGVFFCGWFLWESRRMALSDQGVVWKGRYYKAG